MPDRSLLDDDSWARPRRVASRKAIIVASLLAMSCVGLLSFAFGVNVGKSQAPATNGGFGGFGGANGGFGRSGSGNPAAATPVVAGTANGATATVVGGDAATSTTAAPDPGLGGLLPGLTPAAPAAPGSTPESGSTPAPASPSSPTTSVAAP